MSGYYRTLINKSKPFIIKIDTTLGDGLNRMRLPIQSSEPMLVEDGVGNKQWVVQKDTPNSTNWFEINYAVAGIYQIKISSSLNYIRFSNQGDKDKVTQNGIVTFGDAKINNIFNAFQGCSNLENINDFVRNPDLLGVNAQNAFGDCNFETFPTHLIDFSIFFNIAFMWIRNRLTTFDYIDTSNVTQMRSTWQNNLLTSFPVIPTQNVVNLTLAWGSNKLESFPLLDINNCTVFISTWRANLLQTWLPNYFDNCPATNFLFCWYINQLDQQGVDNIITSINTARLAGIQVTGQTKEIGLDGGTNATPSVSVQGIVDDMRADGWTINLNGY